MSVPARVLCGVVLAVATYRAARAGIAEFATRGNTVAGFRRAAAIEPRNAEFQAAIGNLEEAARLSPRDAGLAIRLGLAREAAGNAEGAETALLSAAAASRKYEPRWTLANFYFRRQRPDDFWRWTRSAFEIWYGDQSALFDLCWALSNDAGEIERRALPAKDVKLRLQYLDYLSARQRWDAAASLAAELRRQGVALDEGAFAWTPIVSQGIAIERASDASWRIALDGGQPEQCELLTRIEAADAGRWRLQAHMTADLTTPDGSLPHSGLQWQVWTHGETPRLLAESDDVPAQGDSDARIIFTKPSGVPLVRVSFRYRKQSGGMRAEGTVRVSHLVLEPAP